MSQPKIICKDNDNVGCGAFFEAHLPECPVCGKEVKNRVERLKIFCSQCNATKKILFDENKKPYHPDICHACNFQYDNN